MKKFFSIFAVAAVACVAFVACSDDETYVPGMPDAADCYGVYFPAQQTSFELDPAEKTELTFTAARTRTDAAITVPVAIKRGGETFSVSEISFAAGAEETEFTVSFPDAQVGTTYNFDLQIEDPLYASVYSQNSSFLYFNVTRVKWNVLGTGDYEYTFWWQGTDKGLTLEQRDGTNMYRIQNWGGGVTLFFTMENGVPTIAKQAIGAEHPSYGTVYVQSTDGEYDPETGTYYFLNKYTVAAGSFGSNVEYFVLTDPAK